ncbi:hypothetical protein GE09DRAFT_116225 [Coniochaeta sp. 2T2.1]|nr:hypothetical protein GE09DRAFT_116225 [Coniochaeta sp. 2T2.1]
MTRVSAPSPHRESSSHINPLSDQQQRIRNHIRFPHRVWCSGNIDDSHSSARGSTPRIRDVVPSFWKANLFAGLPEPTTVFSSWGCPATFRECRWRSALFMAGDSGWGTTRRRYSGKILTRPGDTMMPPLQARKAMRQPGRFPKHCNRLSFGCCVFPIGLGSSIFCLRPRVRSKRCSTAQSRARIPQVLKVMLHLDIRILAHGMFPWLRCHGRQHEVRRLS